MHKIILSELHTVDIHPKKGKQELENGEKCKVGQCNEDSEEINADLKYFLNQTTGVYLENNDIGKVINYEMDKSSYQKSFFTTSQDTNVYFFFDCKTLYICFRGTESVKDIITDLQESVKPFI